MWSPPPPKKKIALVKKTAKWPLAKKGTWARPRRSRMQKRAWARPRSNRLWKRGSEKVANRLDARKWWQIWNPWRDINLIACPHCPEISVVTALFFGTWWPAYFVFVDKWSDMVCKCVSQSKVNILVYNHSWFQKFCKWWPWCYFFTKIIIKKFTTEFSDFLLTKKWHHCGHHLQNFWGHEELH